MITDLDGAIGEAFADENDRRQADRDPTALTLSSLGRCTRAGAYAVSRSVYETLLKQFGQSPALRQRVAAELTRLDLVGKPAPDVFLHAARTLGADPAATFVIEDSVHGIAGARAAGMRVIGFTGAAHSFPGHADALTEAGAETVIRRWADFPAVVAALSDWSSDF